MLVLCNLHKLLHLNFKERDLDVKIGFSKFCTFCPKWCGIAGSSGTHLVCVFTTHQNTILLVDALNWEVTYEDLINKVVCDPSYCEYMVHHFTNCPGTNTLCKFLEEELSDIDPDFQFHYSQWQTADRASLLTITSTCEEYKNTLIPAINTITKHLFLAKCQANFLRAKKESLKANEVIVLGDFAENNQFFVQDEIQSYHWNKEYCMLHPLVVYFIDSDGKIQQNSLCFISDDNNHDTNLFIKYKKSLLITLKKVFQLWIRSSISQTAVLKQYKYFKNFITLCLHQQNFNMDAEWIFFATSPGK